MDISPPPLAFLFSRGRRRGGGNLLLLFLLAKSLRGTAEETFADYSICHFSREILLRLRSNYSINFPISRYAENSFAQRGAPRPLSPSFFTCAGAGRSWKGGGLLLAAFIVYLLFRHWLLSLEWNCCCWYVYMFVYKHFYIDSLILFFSPSRHQWKKLPPPFFNPPPHTPRSPSGLGGKRGKKEK